MFSSPFDIVFFAIIAVFIAFKLYKVLGRTDENDKNMPSGKINWGNPFPKPVEQRTPADEAAHAESNVIGLPRPPEAPMHENAEIATILTAINYTDRNFTAKKFITGARKAFDIVLDAFAKGDKNALAALLSSDVYQEFSDALDARKEAGEELQTTLIAIIESNIIHATLTKNIAHITVKFISDQVNIVKNTAGEIISGDISGVERVEDEWTFLRNVESVNPNWTIIATDHQD
jgi:predicted lipid-binding transport protein (Tim44 family)